MNDKLLVKAQTLFLNQFTDHLDNLKKAIQMSNYNEVKNVIHKLKGTSYMVGFDEIGDVTVAFSDFMDDYRGNKQQLEAYLLQLEEAYIKVKKIL